MSIDPDPYPAGCRPHGFGSLLGTRYSPSKFGSRLADRFDQIEQPDVNLPDSLVQVIAIDQDKEAYEVGLPFVRKAGVEHKINYIHSDGMIALNNLLKNRQEGEIDFAFVDADKENYINYHELLLKLIKVGGIIAYDNTLWDGSVAPSEHEEVEDTPRDALRKLNSFLASDSRIDLSLISIADGLTLCRRLR
ncbi:hypothetical protein RHMOL_Rhmol12G0030600 [Rhododendron molle]|uniref:Uncharacterized protein n=1 Tax=Rhododendron molle TaxID=49168 RepID=A0ACC0LEP7_RHOML|nr:hypothetical protein RHMOL_Rhmol12G0030600 [Rhododendron molle]